jgi:hypothetical protein
MVAVGCGGRSSILPESLMERLWYLSRSGQVFGPMPESHLLHAATTGQIVATDYLNLAGMPNWVPTTAVPGLLALAHRQPEPIAPEWTVRVTCLACYCEMEVGVPDGAASVPCPRCGAAIDTSEVNANAAPFANLESPEQLKARLNQKVEAAYAAAGSRGGDVAVGVDATATDVVVNILTALFSG